MVRKIKLDSDINKAIKQLKKESKIPPPIWIRNVRGGWTQYGYLVKHKKLGKELKELKENRFPSSDWAVKTW